MRSRGARLSTGASSGVEGGYTHLKIMREGLSADAHVDHRGCGMSRLEPGRALAARRARNPGARQLRDRQGANSLPPSPRLRLVEGASPTATWCSASFENFVRPTSSMRPPPTRTRPTGARMSRRTCSARSTWSRPPRANGATRFVNFQTVLCYGRPQQNPIPVDHPLRRSRATAFRRSPASNILR